MSETKYATVTYSLRVTVPSESAERDAYSVLDALHSIVDGIGDVKSLSYNVWASGSEEV